MSSEGGPIAFDSLTKLPEDLAPTAVQVNKFANHYVHRDSTIQKYFSWEEFGRAAKSYSASHYDFVAVKTDTTGATGSKHFTPDGSDLDVVDVVRDDSATSATGMLPGPIPIPVTRIEEISLDNVLGWMVHTLHDVLGVAIDARELNTTIFNTFTNLKWSKDSGFLDWSKSASGNNASWEYRTVFGYPKDGETDKFYAMVTSMSTEANISEESSGWGMVSTKKAKFNSRIRATKVLITKGFKDPA